jgi:hypothetical protein
MKCVLYVEVSVSVFVLGGQEPLKLVRLLGGLLRVARLSAPVTHEHANAFEVTEPARGVKEVDETLGKKVAHA